MKAKRARSVEDAPADHMPEQAGIEEIVGQVVSQVLESHVSQLQEELVRRVLEKLPAEATSSVNATQTENGASHLLKGVSAIHAGTTQREILRALLDNTVRYSGRAALFVIKAGAATHQGNRYAVDRWRSAANMYLFDTNNVSCFFAGDTALTPESTHLVERHVGAAGRRLDLALLPIGHAPWWKPGFRKGHLTSGDALTLFDRLDARYLIPYHWCTFDHVTSKAHDAIRRLRAQLPAHPRSENRGR